MKEEGGGDVRDAAIRTSAFEKLQEDILEGIE